MLFKMWFESKPQWFQYGVLGAIGYPALILFLFILAFITTPIGLRYLFETLISIIVSPAYFLTMHYIYKIFLIESYSSFVFYYIGMITFFTITIGFFMGIAVFFAQQMYQKLIR